MSRLNLIFVNTILASLALVISLSGCSSILDSDRTIGNTFKNPDSFDIWGEQVEFDILGKAEFEKQLKVRGLTDQQIADFMPGNQAFAPGLSVAAVELAYKYIDKEFEKEAGRYQQSYKAQKFVDGYWDPSKQYIGFRLARDTDANKNTNPETPAFEIYCLMVPDQRNHFLIVEPVYVSLQRAKAKVPSGKDKVKMSFELTQSSKWIDKGSLNDTILTTINWDANMKIGDVKRGQQGPVGALVAPPTQKDDDGVSLPRTGNHESTFPSKK